MTASKWPSGASTSTPPRDTTPTGPAPSVRRPSKVTAGSRSATPAGPTRASASRSRPAPSTPAATASSSTLDEPAVREDGTSFDDHEVHKVLDAAGIQRTQRSRRSHARRSARRDRRRPGRSRLRPGSHRRLRHAPRAGRRCRADRRLLRRRTPMTPHPPRFLWNAKMRFGKTFTTYQLAQRMGWKRVLVLTYKPAVRNAWRDDLVSHVDFADWVFADRDTPCDPDTPAPRGVVRLVPGSARHDGRRRGQGAQRRPAPHRLGLHRPRRVPLRRLAGRSQGSVQPRASDAPKRPRRRPRRRRPRRPLSKPTRSPTSSVPARLDSSPPRPTAGINDDLDAADLQPVRPQLPVPVGHTVPGADRGRVQRGRHLQLDLPRRAVGQGRSGTTTRSRDSERNPYRELPQMQMFTYALSEVASVAIDQGADGLFDLSGFFDARKVGSEYHFDRPEPGRRVPEHAPRPAHTVGNGEAAQQLQAAVPLQRRALHRTPSSTPCGSCRPSRRRMR